MPQNNLENYSREQLLEEVESLKKQLKNKYGLIWDKEKEKEKVVLDCEENLPILNEIKEKKIKTDEKKPTNILIEGDNYHALTCLNYTHKEKIDVIYIDPPYNTGNNDFKYNDKFVDKEDDYRHSKWLNFMEKRLKLAKYLLKKSGVIFISIDDNEQANLKLLCDRIFKEKNFIANGVRENKKGAGHDSKNLAIEFDYYLIYSKEKMKVVLNQKKIDVEDDKKYNLKDKFFEKRGKYYLRDLDYKGSYSEKSDYEIILPNKKKIFPGGVFGKPNIWRWSKKKFEWGVKNDFIVFKNNKVYIKQYQYVDNENNVRERKTPYRAISQYLNSEGTTEFSLILKNSDFTNPKPTSLIIHLLKISSNKNSIILDFFAGSGTTGHAVLKLNEEDKGNRQFILCTNNENKICEEVTYPRIEKVINGYYKNGIKQEDKYVKGLGGNLRYYKTDFVKVGSIRHVNDKQREELTKKAGFLIAIKDKCYEEIYFSAYYQLFKNDKDQHVAIYFREDSKEWEEMKEKIKDKETKLYIFSFGNAGKKSCEYLGRNIKIDNIPEPILEVYKGINLTYGKGEGY